jgi:hypothetical protein
MIQIKNYGHVKRINYIRYMIRKKTVKRLSIKKLGKVKPYPVVLTIVSAKDTLFPEKLKRANEVLKQLDLTDF